MIRLTRGADGRARIDMGARHTGRGAYACPTEDCLRGALRKGRLDHALRRATQAPDLGVGEILRQLIGEPQPKARRADR
jgi:predicted RNA-binding protein YlxR (DUF448 family)